jgi:hypothetical protein
MSRTRLPGPSLPSAGVSAAAVAQPPAPPLLAEAWLLAWGRIGGAVTIGTDHRLYPWFHPEIGCSDDECATVLLAELVETPGLPAAVRIILAASLHPKRRRAA